MISRSLDCRYRHQRTGSSALVLIGFLLVANPGLWAKDQAWNSFQAARAFYEEGRFGEALNSWKGAIDQRRDQFSKASAGIEAALATQEARRAKGSIDSLLSLLARKTMTEREIAEINVEARSSLRREAQLFKAKIPEKEFSGFLDGLLAVLEQRGADYLHDSLLILQSTARELQYYPEAEFWIGKIFISEGEHKLGEMQFNRALSMAAALEVPDDRFEILGELASLYRSEERWKDYEDTLKRALEGSTIFSDKNDFLRKAMERALSLQGFDSFIALYRVDESRILGAAADYGEFLLRRGRSQAILHLAIASNGYLTRILTRIKEAEPSYSYSTLSELAPRIVANPELRSWVEEVGLWKLIYYVAEALLDQSERVSGRALLAELSQIPEAGTWARAARLALARPITAPFVLP